MKRSILCLILGVFGIANLATGHCYTQDRRKATSAADLPATSASSTSPTTIFWTTAIAAFRTKIVETRDGLEVPLSWPLRRLGSANVR